MSLVSHPKREGRGIGRGFPSFDCLYMPTPAHTPTSTRQKTHAHIQKRMLECRTWSHTPAWIGQPTYVDESSHLNWAGWSEWSNHHVMKKSRLTFTEWVMSRIHSKHVQANTHFFNIDVFFARHWRVSRMNKDIQDMKYRLYTHFSEHVEADAHFFNFDVFFAHLVVCQCHSAPACHVAHMNESRHTYEWVMSHIWMLISSILTFLLRSWSFNSATRLQRVMSHMNESHHTCRWVTSHIWISHVTHRNKA